MDCWYCEGSGYVWDEDENEVDCPDCDGRGFVHACRGEDSTGPPGVAGVESRSAKGGQTGGGSDDTGAR